jgi:hypothetical protein
MLPELPTGVYRGVFVRDEGELVLVNAGSDNLLRFDEINWTFDVIDGQTIPIIGLGTLALAVHDASLNGCI